MMVINRLVNIHRLVTDDIDTAEVVYCKSLDQLMHKSDVAKLNPRDIDACEKHHLYFTSPDDKIEAGQWYLHKQSPNGLRVQKCISPDNLPMDAKKIIASTDSKLMYLSNNGRIGYSIPRIRLDFILRYCSFNGIDETYIKYDIKMNPDYSINNNSGQAYLVEPQVVPFSNTIVIVEHKQTFELNEVMDLCKKAMEYGWKTYEYDELEWFRHNLCK